MDFTIASVPIRCAYRVLRFSGPDASQRNKKRVAGNYMRMARLEFRKVGEQGPRLGISLAHS
jgi:hypothetical protein